MNKRIRLLIFVVVAVLHITMLLFARFGSGSALAATQPAEAPGIMRLVNIQPAAPSPPTPPVPAQPPLDSLPAPTAQPLVPAEAPPPPQAAFAPTAQAYGGVAGQAEYLRQHEISALPVLPVNEILRNVVYPSIARQLNIEGIVQMELFVDRHGNITNVRLLAETPANRGFGMAALDAFRGIRALRPAELNGVPVAVRFHYNLIFTLR